MITPSPTANAQDVTANPSAFPFPAERNSWGDGIREGSDGMTLRDWYAGKATDADVEDFRTAAQGRDSAYYTNTRAEARFAFADAMLAARVVQS